MEPSAPPEEGNTSPVDYIGNVPLEEQPQIGMGGMGREMNSPPQGYGDYNPSFGDYNSQAHTHIVNDINSGETTNNFFQAGPVAGPVFVPGDDLPTVEYVSPPVDPDDPLGLKLGKDSDSEEVSEDEEDSEDSEGTPLSPKEEPFIVGEPRAPTRRKSAIRTLVIPQFCQVCFLLPVGLVFSIWGTIVCSKGYGAGASSQHCLGTVLFLCLLQTIIAYIYCILVLCNFPRGIVGFYVKGFGGKAMKKRCVLFALPYFCGAGLLKLAFFVIFFTLPIISIINWGTGQACNPKDDEFEEIHIVYFMNFVYANFVIGIILMFYLLLILCFACCSFLPRNRKRGRSRSWTKGGFKSIVLFL